MDGAWGEVRWQSQRAGAIIRLRTCFSIGDHERGRTVMTPESNVLIERIYEQARQLPPESLADLAKYVEFLRFKDRSFMSDEPLVSGKLRIVNMRGLLKGYDFSPELLVEVRREMWQSLEREEA